MLLRLGLELKRCCQVRYGSTDQADEDDDGQHDDADSGAETADPDR
jgi:hypothetical protein